MSDKEFVPVCRMNGCHGPHYTWDHETAMKDTRIKELEAQQKIIAVKLASQARCQEL